MAEGGASKDERLARELHQAVEGGDVSKLKALLGQGADPSHQLYWCEGGWGEYPSLHYACYEGYLEIVKTLLSVPGVDVDKGWGWYNATPLHLACMQGHKEVVVYLITEAGCKVDVRDDDNETPLHWACREGHKEVVCYLIEEEKYDLDVRDKYNRTPLHLACMRGRIEVVRYFLEEVKYDVDVRDKDNRTPLHLACISDRIEVVRYFLEEVKYDVDVRDKDNHTPLHLACIYGHIEVVQYFLEELKWDVGVRDDKGRTLVDLILEEMYDGNAVGVALYLINNGCACGDKEKGKLLCEACYWGKLDVVKELVEQYKIDPSDVRNDKGQSPLDMVLEWGVDAFDDMNAIVALFLMDRGCTCSDKRLLLCLLCLFDKLDALKELVEQHKLDLSDVRDDNNRTPLHLASKNGHKKVAQYLISEGKCDIYVRDDENRTPLHSACEGGYKEMVKYLIEEFSCDIAVTDDNGDTPVDLATKGSKSKDLDERRRCTEVLDYLKSLPSTHSTMSSEGQHQGLPPPIQARTQNDSSTLSLDCLMKYTGVTDKQLDRECSEKDLGDISEHVIQYRKYGPKLGLSGADIVDIETNPHFYSSIKLKSEAVLKKWRTKNPIAATFRVLVEVALEKEDGAGAVKICEICAKGLPSEGSSEGPTAPTGKKRRQEEDNEEVTSVSTKRPRSEEHAQ